MPNPPNHTLNTCLSCCELRVPCPGWFSVLSNPGKEAKKAALVYRSFQKERSVLYQPWLELAVEMVYVHFAKALGTVGS